MKKKIWSIILLILLAIGAALLLTEEDVKLITQDLDFNGNTVINTTAQPMYDTILSYSLKSLDIKNSTIIIADLNDDINKENFSNLRGAVGITKDAKLVMFLAKMKTKESLDVIPHEAIHIKQHVDSTLIALGGDKAMFKNNIYDLSKTPYDERPWEIEAFHEGPKLSKKLRKTIVVK